MLTAEHLKLRLGKATSSVAAGALGISPHMSRIDAAMAIWGENPFEGNKATRRGNRMEAPTLDEGAAMLQDTTGLHWEWEPAPFVQHPKYDWAGDSTDALYYRVVDGKRILALAGEAKTAGMGQAHRWGVEGTEDIPDEYRIQCHWHLIHWPEVNECLVPVLIGGYEFEFRNYIVRRDIELEGMLLQEIEKFYVDYVVPRKIPPAKSKDTDTLLRLFPRATEGMMADNPEIERYALMAIESGKEKRKWEAIEKEAKNNLRQLIGHHEGVSGTWGSCTYRNAAPKSVTDWQGVSRHLKATPELIKEHTTEQLAPRIMRFSPAKQPLLSE